MQTLESIHRHIGSISTFISYCKTRTELCNPTRKLCYTHENSWSLTVIIILEVCLFSFQISTCCQYSQKFVDSIVFTDKDKSILFNDFY